MMVSLSHWGMFEQNATGIERRLSAVEAFLAELRESRSYTAFSGINGFDPVGLNSHVVDLTDCGQNYANRYPLRPIHQLVGDFENGRR